MTQQTKLAQFKHPFFVILGIITILYCGYQFGVFTYKSTH